MIPKVKTWQLTLDNGEKVAIDAPTKYLARLNFRHECPQYWGVSVKSVGLKRVKS